MNKRMFFLSFSILFVQLNVFSQQSFKASGLIQDDHGNPIEGAAIKVLNTEIGTLSDKNGRFIFSSIPMKYESIEVSAIGYATLIVNFRFQEKDAHIEIQMKKIFMQLDDILISAEKHEAQLQKTALTVSGLTSKDIENYRLWNIEQISGIIPNLYTSNSGDGRNVTSIRGIATTAYDQSISTYVDGVSQFGLDTYIPQLFDVERIEILRGAQGTLYGRNAMGGVINIITKKPTNKQEGSFDISIGNYGTQRISGSFKTPLIRNKLFLGTAILYDKTNGYYTNTFNNKNFDSKSLSAVNFYLKYLPSSYWDLTLNIKTLQSFNNGPFPLQIGKDIAFEKLFKVDQNQITKMSDASTNASLVINHHGKGFSFNAITALQSNYRFYKSPIDGDFSIYDIVSIQNNFGKKFNNVKVFTQEFRLSSPLSKNSGLRWTTGAYFFSQNNPVKQATYFGEDAFLYGLDQKDFSIITTNKGLNQGFALYGQTILPLSPKFELTAGIRFDQENRKLSIGESYKAGDFIMPLINDTSGSARFTAITPKAGLNFLVSQQSIAFFNYSRGFRTGGLTQISSDPSTPPLQSYNPEYSNNIELGWKNNFFNNQLTMNVTSFITFVNNAQTPTLILPDAITVIRNSGKLISKGIETDVEWLASKSIQFSYHAGITDSKYDQLILENGVNLKGNHQIFTPAYTSLVAGQYNAVVKSKYNLRFNLRTEWLQLGKQFFDLKNTITQNAYGLLNFKTGLSNEYFSIQFWVRNTVNKKYISYAYDFGGIHLGNPRNYGITLGIKFN